MLRSPLCGVLREEHKEKKDFFPENGPAAKTWHPADLPHPVLISSYL